MPDLFEAADNTSLTELRSPDAYVIQEARVSSLVFSELRVLDATCKALEARVAEIADNLHCDKRIELDKLFRGFSIQLELNQAGLISECGERPIDSSLSSLIDALRTYAEEAAYGGWRKDPVENAEFMLEVMRREFNLTMETRFSRFSVSESFQDDFAIREFDPERLSVRPELLDTLEEICTELVIDTNYLEPQEGYGRHVSANELANHLSKKGSRLFVPYYKDMPVGLYIIHSDKDSFPKTAAEIIKKETGQALFPNDGDGWGEIVGFSREASRKLKEQGISGYKVLSAAMSETATGLGIERLWGEVRVGIQANTARDKHLTAGWKPTGLVCQYPSHPYEILVFQPLEEMQRQDPGRAQFRWNIGFNHSDKWLSHFSDISHLAKDFDFNFEHDSDIADFNPEDLQDIKGLRESVQKHFRESVALDFRQEHSGRINIFILRDGVHASDRNYALKQKVPGKDLWKLEFPVYYELGLGNPMLPLNELVDRISDFL